MSADASPLIAVVGASGTGKSSVVKAGLLPRLLTAGDWTIVRMPRLGEDPGSQLAAAEEQLAVGEGDDNEDDDHHRLLVIDQFEELYTQCPDPAVRDRFLDRLGRLLAGGDVRVLLTLRSDFEPRLAAAPALGERLAGGRYLVPAFRSEELREIIEGPAQVKALWFEPAELVGELVDEVMAMPGALPLLSFALAEMYRRARLRRRQTGATDRALTRGDYTAAGGVVGSLHQRATELYEAADAASRETIRRLFLRMVSREGGRLARRRVAAEELEYADPGEQERVRQARDEYVAARLWVADEGYLEPAHDTLVLAWEKLLQWLAEHGSQELERQVWRAARGWDEARRQQGTKAARGLLWDGDPRLPQARTIAAELNRLEQGLLDASVERRKRRRWTSGALVAAVIAALAALALYSAGQARLAGSRLAAAKQTVREIAFTIDRDLRPIAGAAKVRQGLQEKTRELLEKLRAEDDLDVRYQQAVSHQRTAELALRSGDLAKAEEDSRRAAEMLEEAIRSLPADDPRKPEFRDFLATIYHHRGRVAAAIGELGTAQEWLEKSLAVIESLASVPDAPTRYQHRIAKSYGALGRVAVSSGSWQRARELHDQSLEILRRDAESEPANSEWRRDLAEGYGNLGNLANNRGQSREAREWHLQQMETLRRLVETEPWNATWKDHLAEAYMVLALTDSLLGDRAATGQWREEGLHIWEELARAEPENVDWQRRLAAGYSSFGIFALEEDQDPAAARGWFEKALPIIEALVEASPENTKAQSTLAGVYSALGSVHWIGQELVEAGRFHQQAVEIYERLTTMEPNNADWQGSLATACRDVGGVAIAEATGDWTRARRRLRQAVEIYQLLAAAAPENKSLQWDLGTAYSQSGQLAIAEGDPRARESFEQALKIFERLIEEGPGPGGAYLMNFWEMHWRLSQLLAAPDPDAAQRHAERAEELWIQVQALSAAPGDESTSPES